MLKRYNSVIIIGLNCSLKQKNIKRTRVRIRSNKKVIKYQEKVLRSKLRLNLINTIVQKVGDTL